MTITVIASKMQYIITLILEKLGHREAHAVQSNLRKTHAPREGERESTESSIEPDSICEPGDKISSGGRT